MNATSPSQQQAKVQIRMPDDLMADLKMLAAARHRSVSNLTSVVMADFVRKEKLASSLI